MRTRLQIRLPSVLALALVSLLLVPLTALAQAPAISMYPETAGPGSTVEVAGIDFPPGRVVEVQLATPDGTVPLTSATTSGDGDFRQVLTLPLGISEGSWELQATTADGTTSRFAFMTSPDAAVEAVAVAPAPAPAASGNSSGDIALMLIIAVVLGGLAFGGIVVYRHVRDESPPGMGKGDDLIWGGGTAETPEQTATEEPHWKAAQTAHTES
jgi:hypothetical protein